MDITFITGNQFKADYLAESLGLAVRHRKIDLDEIQSLDLFEVVQHKVKNAYRVVDGTVLVEDISLAIDALHGLPGPLVKWFLASLGNAGVAELAQRLDSQDATVTIMYGLYDGQELHTFQASTAGHIAERPQGEQGFGFQDIFIPGNAKKTFAEMTSEEMKPYYHRLRAVNDLRAYLERLT